jgi:pyrimidine deaminase RibD-like protein
VHHSRPARQDHTASRFLTRNGSLAAAGPTATGGTAVVTLEPCNHYGRTPPCHQALLDAGIVRILIAVLDPTSRGEGGAARLRQAGVEVQIALLAGVNELAGELLGWLARGVLVAVIIGIFICAMVVWRKARQRLVD